MLLIVLIPLFLFFITIIIVFDVYFYSVCILISCLSAWLFVVVLDLDYVI